MFVAGSLSCSPGTRRECASIVVSKKSEWASACGRGVGGVASSRTRVGVLSRGRHERGRRGRGAEREGRGVGTAREVVAWRLRGAATARRGVGAAREWTPW